MKAALGAPNNAQAVGWAVASRGENIIAFAPEFPQAARMKIATIIVRVLLGLMFTVFGSNAFLQFMPMPELTGYPRDFIGSMAASGYIYFVAAFQVIGGLILLSGRYVPLGLTLLGPVIVNIVIYHLCMDRSGMAMATIVAALSLFLLWRYRDAFAGLLRP